MPGTLDSSEVVVGGNGAVYVAGADTVGLTFPTDLATALHASFVQVGFTSEDGVTFTDGQTIEDINAWQSFYPIRKVITEKMTSLEFVMRQWNQINLQTAFGGGTITESAGGVTKYTPPAPGAQNPLAMVVEWIDGLNTFRLVFPRGLVTGEVSTNVVRTTAADLPIHFDATPEGAPVPGDNSTQPWYLLTDAIVTT